MTAVAMIAAALQPLHAATFAGVEVAPPLPAKPVVDTYFGTSVEDPYRFLEDTGDPVVQTWMRAQADATAAILANLPARGCARRPTPLPRSSRTFLRVTRCWRG